MSRGEADDELKRTFSVLAEDIELARAYGKNNNSPYAQRTLLRTHFALIEGVSYLLRQIAIATAEVFSPAELATLSEKTYTLDKQGNIQERDNYLKALPALLFTLRCYARVHGAIFQLETGSEGWRCMQAYVAIRNRLAHPKKAVDLQLSDAELQECLKAAEWFKTTFKKLLEACEAADNLCRSRGATQPPVQRDGPPPAGPRVNLGDSHS